MQTYVPAADMQASDWSEVTSIRLQVTFANPLQGEAGQGPVTFTKVIDIMSRTGVPGTASATGSSSSSSSTSSGSTSSSSSTTSSTSSGSTSSTDSTESND